MDTTAVMEWKGGFVVEEKVAKYLLPLVIAVAGAMVSMFLSQIAGRLEKIETRIETMQVTAQQTAERLAVFEFRVNQVERQVERQCRLPSLLDPGTPARYSGGCTARY